LWGGRFRLPTDCFTPSKGADPQSVITRCLEIAARARS
jgi:hypothetical protein